MDNTKKTTKANTTTPAKYFKSLKKPNSKAGKVSPPFPTARDYSKRLDKTFNTVNKKKTKSTNK